MQEWQWFLVKKITLCKKDYTCECTSTVGQSGNTISSTVSTTIKDKKSAAEDACEKGSMDASTATYVSKTECKIK